MVSYTHERQSTDRLNTMQHSRPPRPSDAGSTFSLQDSMARMFSSGSSIKAIAGRDSSSIRRWKSKSTTSAATPSTPLHNRTNTMKTNSTGPGANTTFLPEFHSTPPMPSFQKPMVVSPRTSEAYENSPPPKRFSTVSRRPDSQILPLPPIADPGRLLANPGTKVGPALVSRVEGTPPLPRGWTQQHDRAICVLDARNYSLPAIVVKVRRAFPQLKGVLTVGMVDKRLRQLDQDVEIDYWRIGLQGTKNATPAPGAGSSGEPVVEEGRVSVEAREPTLRTGTASGSLLKSQSTANSVSEPVTVSTKAKGRQPNKHSSSPMLQDMLNGFRSVAV